MTLRIGTKVNHKGAVWVVTGLAPDGVLIEDEDGDVAKIKTEEAQASAVKRKRPPRPPRKPAIKPTEPTGEQPVSRRTWSTALAVQSVLLLVLSLGGAYWLDHRGDVGPIPDPSPIVDPLVPPAPAPDSHVVKKGALLIIVEETAERDKFPHLATLQKDVKFWDGLAERGYKHAWLDAEMKQIAPYKPHWEKVGLPCLLAIMPDGTVPLAISCPPSTETINQHLEP